MQAENQRQLQVGVKVFIFNQKGDVLLLKRNPETHPDVGEQWDIPGGRICTGLPLLENLTREIFEETKLSLEGEPQILCAQDIFPQGKHVVRITYVGKALGEVLLSAEHTEYLWVPRETLADYLDSTTKKAIPALIAFHV